MTAIQGAKTPALFLRFDGDKVQRPIFAVGRFEFLPSSSFDGRFLAEFSTARIEPPGSESAFRCGKIHRDGAAMREVGDVAFPRLGKCDGVAGDSFERLHAPERKRRKEIAERAQLSAGAFVFHGERIVVRRVETVPRVAVADGAVEAGG